MKTTRHALRTAALAALLALPACAKPLHDNPAADDNLRIYVFLGTPKVSLSLDRSAPKVLEDANSVVFAKVAPGPHTWTVTVPGGVATTADVTLTDEGMIESKSRRWWCLAAGGRDGGVSLTAVPPAQCKSIADQGPD